MSKSRMLSWRRIWVVVGGLLIATSAVVVGMGFGLVPAPITDDVERAHVTISNGNGRVSATVEARVADTSMERYRGLSDAERLRNGTGMLFVFDREAERTFVMRDMDFPLDIIFIGADDRITQIHHAPVPPPGTNEWELTPYRGRAKWVLEVPRGYGERYNISTGDVVDITYTE